MRVGWIAISIMLALSSGCFGRDKQGPLDVDFVDPAIPDPRNLTFTLEFHNSGNNDVVFQDKIAIYALAISFPLQLEGGSSGEMWNDSSGERARVIELDELGSIAPHTWKNMTLRAHFPRTNITPDLLYHISVGRVEYSVGEKNYSWSYFPPCVDQQANMLEGEQPDYRRHKCGEYWFYSISSGR